jgi:hypothetical protein
MEVILEMRKKLISVILMVTVLSMGFTIIDAKKPLYGTTDLQFNLGFPGPQTEIPVWLGTINIDNEEYGMIFFNIGSGKSFVDTPSESNTFFGEIWVIFEWIEIEFDEFGALASWNAGPKVLLGTDEGVVTFKNDKYRMNGEVTEAYGIFSGWIGRSVYMNGIIQWYPFGAPQYAPGEFRIN